MFQLHEHSDYSNAPYLDAVNRVKDLVRTNFSLGLSGAAITDHDFLAGHVKFVKEAEKLRKEGKKKLEENPNDEEALRAANFKWILGNEVYLTKEGQSQKTHAKGDKFFHMILLAKDYIGWQQLNRLSSISWDRVYYRGIPRRPLYISDLEKVIGEEPGHIFATSACLGSYIGHNFLEGSVAERDAKALGFIDKMNSIFGFGNFFLEVQPGQSPEQIAYNKYLFELNKKTKTPVVVASDAHYPRPEYKEVHKAFLNSQEAEGRETGHFYDYTYLMSEQEIRDFLLTHLTLEQANTAIENTRTIGNQVELYDIFKEPIIPTIPFSEEDKWETLIHKYDEYKWFEYFSHSNRHDKFLIYNIIKGIEKKNEYGWFEDERTTIDKVLERVNIELEVIKEISDKLKQNMSSYFTTFQRILDIAWQKAIVAPGRGSAGAFLINFLIDITQINPLTQPIEHPFWRFLMKDKASMPDIDIDLPSSLKKEVIENLQAEFKKFGSTITNIAAFRTEKSKSAILTAARGLGYEPEDALYFASLVPSDRGFLRSLNDCYYGNEEKEFKPIKEFVEEMNLRPDLWEVAQRIEGLISGNSIHPAGIAIFESNKIYTQAATFVAPGGQKSIQFDLADAELVGVLKYDLLATDAIDGIQTELYLLAEYGYIDWQSNLKETYNKYFHPMVIEYKNQEMWKLAHEKKVLSLFQFADSPVGEAAMEDIKPNSLLELGTVNSVMRLMAADGAEMPVVQYRHRKENILIWYQEMKAIGLTDYEMEILKRHLLSTYGMCITQEQLMLISQDPEISNFSPLQSDTLRKAVAKKKADMVEPLRVLFYKQGAEVGARKVFLDYIWNNLFAIQFGYAFSQIHTNAYSIIALQQMNLNYFYPSILWAVSRLMVESGAIGMLDEDLEILQGDPSEEDDEDEKDTESTTVNYFKMSAALGKLRNFGIDIELPNINTSNFTFSADVDQNKIYFGLKGISRVNNPLIEEIMKNRPYSSLEDFLSKVKVNKVQATMLIKAGVFDSFGNREDILYNYCDSVADKKKKLNLQNLARIIELNLIPDKYIAQVHIYKIVKHLKKFFTFGDYIVPDENMLNYIEKYNSSLIKSKDGQMYLELKEMEKWYKKEMEVLKKYIADNHDFLLEKVNEIAVKELLEKYAKGNKAVWEMEALSYYYSYHELNSPEFYDWLFSLGVENFFDLPEEPRIVWQGDSGAKKFELCQIVGTSIGRDKNKHIVGLLTPDGFIKVKFYRSQFVKYDKQIKENGVIEKSWFSKGTKLLLTGYRSGDTFIPKSYKDTITPPILKIDGPGNLIKKRLGEE